MEYISTRGGAEPQSFLQILLGGLAPDGGLYVPTDYPRVSLAQLEAWRSLDYAELAFAILSRFAPDIAGDDLRGLVHRTYTPAVYCHTRPGENAADITPVRRLEDGLFILALSNGPTLAFKDMAMQLLGNLFEYVLARTGATLNILGATSGDTGSAAEYAMRGKRSIRVFMLSPFGAMSPFQRAQMYSLMDPNIHNLAVRGSFDDCQDIVKAVSNDLEFKSRYHIGAVNSINWGRIAAQVVYYFKAYLAVVEEIGRQVSFAVPSGNFGNVLAGHIARMMGLPIRRLIVATNENDVLDEFFRTGHYAPRARTLRTSSPSMDISKASNFERMIFDAVGRDPARIRQLWSHVDRGEGITLSAEEFARVKEFGFVSGRSTHANRIATIRMVYEKYGQIIDPHTADGLKVGLEYREPEVPLICLETALPAKFEETIREALGRPPERPADLLGLEERPQRVEVVEADVEQVKRYIAAHA
ncbi:MAG: threonine synthase [Burkholderiales bacterium]|nr:threonine synthase [Burkholderiales bacterium]